MIIVFWQEKRFECVLIYEGVCSSSDEKRDFKGDSLRCQQTYLCTCLTAETKVKTVNINYGNMNSWKIFSGVKRTPPASLIFGQVVNDKFVICWSLSRKDAQTLFCFCFFLWYFIHFRGITQAHYLVNTPPPPATHTPKNTETIWNFIFVKYVVRHCNLRQKQAKPLAVPRPVSWQKTASRVRSAVGCGGVPGSSKKWHTAHCRHQSVICKVSSLDGSLPRHFLLYPPPACVQPATRLHGIIRMHSCRFF